LFEKLVCPLCKGPLRHDRQKSELICGGDRLAFPVIDGIPMLWSEKARELDTPENAG